MTSNQIRTALIKLFEDVFTRSLSNSPAERAGFQPTLIVDMRQGCFTAAVASLDTNQHFHRTARPVSVEEADRVNPTLDRTTLSVYCKKGSRAWRACSVSRLNEVQTQSGNQVALNVFSSALDCPIELQTEQFVNMCLPFLRMFKENKTDYTSITVLLDDQRHIALFSGALQRLSEVLDDTHWTSAQLLYINPLHDLRGFAFLNEAAQELQNAYRFLLLQDIEHAIEISYEGGFFYYALVAKIDNLNSYSKIGVTGLSGLDKAFDPRVLYLGDSQQLQDIAVMNYVLWLPTLLKRIPMLYKHGTELQQAIRQTQAQNGAYSALLKRLEHTVTNVESLLRTKTR